MKQAQKLANKIKENLTIIAGLEKGKHKWDLIRENNILMKDLKEYCGYKNIDYKTLI